jgi:2-(1,2-epoxy-1,2-dihydrophenyl)acetyl-CoA isomerase
MTEGPVLLQVADGVATITLNRPEAMNALDLATKTALLAALRAVAGDPAARCLVLTGRGRAFCVGQDLKEHAAALRESTPEEVWTTVVEHFNPIAQTLHELDLPVLAAVNGVAAGAGASLAFLADLRIVAVSAGFNLAFTGIGLSCDTGSSWTLPRLVGPTRALDLLINPRTVPADEAYRMGIATEVVPDDELAGRAAAVAAGLAAGPTRAYGAVRRAVAYSAGHPFAAAVAFEAEQMRLTGGTADHRNAVASFLAKQRPTFTGR